MPIVHEVLAALRFYASGSFQSVIGDTRLDLSASCICRSLRRVSLALQLIQEQLDNFVVMPYGQEADNAKTSFYKFAGVYCRLILTSSLNLLEYILIM